MTDFGLLGVMKAVSPMKQQSQQPETTVHNKPTTSQQQTSQSKSVTSVTTNTHTNTTNTTTNNNTNKKQLIKTIIIKTDHGIGLDIYKTNDNGVIIQKLKDMPEGVINPASQCNPAVLPGDIIVGVNGKSMKLFNEIVKAIRSCTGQVEIWLERKIIN